jgi:hypothetical protein
MLITNTSIEARGLQEYGVKQNQVRVAGVGIDIPDFSDKSPAVGVFPKPYVV